MVEAGGDWLVVVLEVVRGAEARHPHPVLPAGAGPAGCPVQRAVREAEVVRCTGLRPEDLVDGAEHALPLTARAEGGGGVACNPQPVGVVVHCPQFGIFSELRESYQLLVEPRILLYLMSPPRYFHLYPILLLLLEKMMFLVCLVVTAKGRGVPRACAQLAGHGGVGPGVVGGVVVVVGPLVGPRQAVRIRGAVVEAGVPLQPAGARAAV